MPVGYSAFTIDDYSDLLAQSCVPTNLHAGLARYFVARIRPGRFLSAVLENDLATAMNAGDDECRAQLFGIVAWILNNAPDGSYGSPSRVQAWIERRDINERRNVNGNRN